MNEPIEDSGELNEGEEGGGEFFVAGADASVAFNPAEEIFDLMPVAIVAAVERDGVTARAFWRDAGAGALTPQFGAQGIGVEALVADGSATAQAAEQWIDGVQIMPLALGQTERNGTSATLHNRGELGVDATLGATDRLGRLAAARVRSILMQFDVGAIEMPQLTGGSDRHQRQHAREQSARTPTPKPRVDRTPRSKLLRQIAPRQTGAQDVEYRGEHEPIILRRAAPLTPSTGFAASAVNFFSLRHNGSGSSLRNVSFMRALGLPRSFSVPSDFANTP